MKNNIYVNLIRDSHYENFLMWQLAPAFSVFFHEWNNFRHDRSREKWQKWLANFSVCSGRSVKRSVPFHLNDYLHLCISWFAAMATNRTEEKLITVYKYILLKR